MENTLKVRSIRAADDIYDRFKTLAAEFPNQSEALSSLISAWELQQARAVITDRSAEISDYNSHLQAIQAAFLHSLEMNENAESRIRQEFRSMLDSKDKTIADLQQRLEQAAEATRTAENKVREAADNIEAVKKKLEAETKARQAAEKNAQAAESATADKEKIIESLTRQLATADGAEARIAAAEAKAAKEKDAAREARAAAAQATATVDRVKAEAQISKAQAEIETQRAVLQAQKESQERISKLMDENHDLLKQLTELQARKVRNT